jgi:alanyl-tRNA synthetase
LIFDGAVVDTLSVGQEGQVVLDETPFYAEGGGQMGDSGTLSGPGARFTVRDTQKIGASFAHIGVVESGTLRVGDELEARVDGERRTAIALNHSATHLLHAALRAVLGKHVQQKGSLVAPDRLRFDFSHTQAVTTDDLRKIEEMVNRAIRRNDPAQTRVMALDDAVAAGAMSLFGEKYESDVRVLSFGDFSMELCGGTHVERTGDIGLFKIISETGVAAGIRRIEAVTGQAAYEWVVRLDQVVRDIAGVLRGSREDVDEKVRELVDRSKRLEKELQQLKSKLATGQGGDVSARQRPSAALRFWLYRSRVPMPRRCEIPSISSSRSSVLRLSSWRRSRRKSRAGRRAFRPIWSRNSRPATLPEPSQLRWAAGAAGVRILRKRAVLSPRISERRSRAWKDWFAIGSQIEFR